ncbi:hypothetical protein OsI_20974 [Oryza sativa Indica Group]|uniref:Uncharacterized protein n=1 Tax=Oryza sativa subsp. indica TaxID=39946 RepID=B8AWQ5_ORYSI|nr:hypothetical protein OsI_20974 [Oryza sativa Indica Group]
MAAQTLATKAAAAAEIAWHPESTSSAESGESGGLQTTMPEDETVNGDDGARRPALKRGSAPSSPSSLLPRRHHCTLCRYSHPRRRVGGRSDARRSRWRKSALEAADGEREAEAMLPAVVLEVAVSENGGCPAAAPSSLAPRNQALSDGISSKTRDPRLRPLEAWRCSNLCCCGCIAASGPADLPCPYVFLLLASDHAVPASFASQGLDEITRVNVRIPAPLEPLDALPTAPTEPYSPGGILQRSPTRPTFYVRKSHQDLPEPVP